MILSSEHAPKPAQLLPSRRSSRGSGHSSKSETADLFPPQCFICKKQRMQRAKKNIKLRCVTTKKAEITIKAAAKEKMASFYYENKYVDLIAKELQYHEPCYSNFTVGYSELFRENIESSRPVESSNSATDDVQQQGDYASVQQYINDYVLEENQAVSMGVLHSIYDLHVGDSRYRAKLKTRIANDFKERITFISTANNLPDMIINASTPTTEIAFQDKNGCIIKAAEYLRSDILSYCENLPELNWPPNVEQLSQDERSPPSSVLMFLKYLLNVHHSKKKLSESVTRVINSFASDMVFAVSQRRTITAKHFLLALGLHNITGQRKVVEIVNRLGHCLDYNTTCEIETAQAVKSQLLSQSCSSLPLLPSDPSNYVLTVFWVDNFDVKVERQTGSNSINTTHLVAFQEKSQYSVQRANEFTIERTKKRSIQLSNVAKKYLHVNPKKEPPLIAPETAYTEQEVYKKTFEKFFLWLWLRKENSFDQQVPNFSGWLLQHRNVHDLAKTILTYLPPINSKVTDFETIVTYMEYLQTLASQVNMQYVNITLDVGAAMNAFKTVWNHPLKFNNIVIHLGDFHFMKENFQVSSS